MSPDLLDAVAAHAVGRALMRIDCRPAPPDFGPDPVSVAALGRWLAQVHALSPESAPDLACLPVPLLPPAKTAVQKARAAIDRAGEPRPALEYCLAWLDHWAPAAARITLTLGDAPHEALGSARSPANGAALWSRAAWGDPAADLGLVATRLEPGPNVVDRLMAAYADAGGLTIRQPAVCYWQIMALARRAVRSLDAGARVRAGERSLASALERAAAAGHEHAALDLIERYESHLATGEP